MTTDIITGFPGETDAEWQETLEFVEEQAFGHIHVFTYSEREGTKAALMANPVPLAIRQQRSRELQSLSDRLKDRQLQRLIGHTAEVLWERGKPVHADQTAPLRFYGYTPNYHRVSTTSENPLSNTITTTQLTQIHEGLLTGELMTDAIVRTA